ncbi:unnamed protein product [Somion occarium]|uniref:Secreted protein n=1 Tax=Somion occarium TaxID=3059160 RepID=A0ABP1CN50_9APHY
MFVVFPGSLFPCSSPSPAPTSGFVLGAPSSVDATPATSCALRLRLCLVCASGHLLNLPLMRSNFPLMRVRKSWSVIFARSVATSGSKVTPCVCTVARSTSMFLRLTGHASEVSSGLEGYGGRLFLSSFVPMSRSVVWGECVTGVPTAAPPSSDLLGNRPPGAASARLLCAIPIIAAFVSPNCIRVPVLEEVSTPSNDSRYSTRSLASRSCPRVKFMLPGTFQLLEFHHDGLELV